MSFWRRASMWQIGRRTTGPHLIQGLHIKLKLCWRPVKTVCVSIFLRTVVLMYQVEMGRYQLFEIDTISIYTVKQEQDIKLLSISLPLTDYHNSFTAAFSRNLNKKRSLHIPTFVNDVTTLLCEILVSKIAPTENTTADQALTQWREWDIYRWDRPIRLATNLSFKTSNSTLFVTQIIFHSDVGVLRDVCWSKQPCENQLLKTVAENVYLVP